jgi:LPXTG-site transpeptidase (sortase) family protein
MAIWRRALSNILLGLALGLVSYYALTTAAGSLEQRSLRRAAIDVPAFADAEPVLAEPIAANPLDFSGWEQEDQAYWLDPAQGESFARLVIPKIGLDSIVVRNTNTASLRKGPGWMDWTSLPGPTGTCGIAGHRTTYGAPFRRIDELAPGDTVDLYSPYRRYRYEVLRTVIVRPWETEVLHPEEQPSLALSACHPPLSAQYRIVVQAQLTDVQRLESTGE